MVIVSRSVSVHVSLPDWSHVVRAGHYLRRWLGAFQPAGGLEVSCRSMVLEPGWTSNVNPEVSFERYRRGVMGLPGVGVAPGSFSTDGSLATTVTR